LDGTYDVMFAQVAAVFESDAEVAAGGFDDRAGTSTARVRGRTRCTQGA